jgi:hypothetical protein
VVDEEGERWGGGGGGDLGFQIIRVPPPVELEGGYEVGGRNPTSVQQGDVDAAESWAARRRWTG